MIFYLETNPLYDLANITPTVLERSYTSALAILEIIAGITPDDYHRRRTVIEQIQKRNIHIEWVFPQQLVFDSFTVFGEHELIDNRIVPLKTLFDGILNNKTYSEFSATSAFCHDETGWKFFSELDVSLGKEFVEATATGNILMRESLAEKSEFELEGEHFVIESNKEAIAFFEKFPLVNNGYTVMALAKKYSVYLEEFSEEKVFNSYNNNIDIFITAFSKYTAHKIFNLYGAARNDFQDLSHLLYLRNNDILKIVSRDKIYRQFASKHVVDW